MKRTLKGIAAASIVLGMMAPAAFASTSSLQWEKTNIQFAKYTANGVSGYVENNTTYMPIWYVLQAHKQSGYDYTYDGKVLNISTPSGVTPDTSNIDLGFGNLTIQINGTDVKKVITEVHKDPAGGKHAVDTTYIPIYYIQQILKAVHFHNTWDGTNWKGAQLSSVSVSAANSSVSVGQGDQVTFVLKDSDGNTVTPDNVTYSVTDANGNPTDGASVSSHRVFTANQPGTYVVTVNADGVVGHATITVYGIAAAVQLSAPTTNIVADGSSKLTVTAKVVDANGNVVSNFNGTAQLSKTGSDISLPTPATVTFKNGVGTFTVTSNSNQVGNTDTITVSRLTSTNGAPIAPNVNYGSLQLQTVAPTASQLALSVQSGQPTSLSANTQNVTYVVVTVNDQAGVQYNGSGQYVTLNLQGPGSFSSSSTVTSTTVWVTGQSAAIPVYSLPGQAGTITISASASGLQGASLNIPTYINTSPAKISVTSKNDTDANGNAYTLYTVQLLDTNGNPISGASDALSITDNASTQGGQIVYGTVDSNGNFTAGTKPTQLVNGVATFAVETQKVGTSPVTITVKDTTNNFTATATYNFAPGAVSGVSVTPSSSAVYKVQPGQSVTYSAQLVDANQNPVAQSGQSVEFAFVSDGAGALFPNGSNQGVYYATTNSNGVASVTINVPSSAQSGTTFQVEAALASGTLNWQQGATVQVVSAKSYATQIVLTGQPKSSVQAGTTIPDITAQPENAVGDNVSGDVLQITTSNPNVVALPSYDQGSKNTDTLSAGATTISGLQAKMAGTATITVKDISNPSAPSASFQVTVAPGAVSTSAQLSYNGTPITSNNPLTVSANTPVAITITHVDAGGNPVPVTAQEANGPSGLSYVLSDPNGGQFRATPNGASIEYVTIPVGQTSTTVYYVNSTAGSYSGMTATVLGNVSAVQSKSGNTVTGSVVDQAHEVGVAPLDMLTATPSGYTLKIAGTITKTQLGNVGGGTNPADAAMVQYISAPPAGTQSFDLYMNDSYLWTAGANDTQWLDTTTHWAKVATTFAKKNADGTYSLAANPVRTYTLVFKDARGNVIGGVTYTLDFSGIQIDNAH